jgi:cation-transporting P-type ATPase C
VNNSRIAHELAGRLRVRLPWLNHPFLALDEFEAGLLNLEGVAKVRANPHARSLLVEYDGRTEVREAVLQWLGALSLPDFLHPWRVESTRRPDPSLLIASGLALLSLPLLPTPLRAAVTLLSVSPTLYKGAATLLKRGVKVEVLDALAVGIAAGQGAFFTANATHALIETGAYLETRAEWQAHGLLQQLLKRPTEQAWVARNGGLFRIDAGDIVKDERVVVGPGDPIPVDGRVEQGSALLDQSSLTGESVPVRKEQGDSVLTGCVVVEGRLVVRALQVGEQTATARMARFIQQALQHPSDSQRLAERLGDRLVYLTFALGGLLFALTFDPKRLAAVFLVDYSCALKLGTPLAFIRGMHTAAGAGILFKGAQALENLAGADTVVFDKTGTLTHGRLEITDVISLTPERAQDELLALVASVEEHTRHPFAEALVRHAGRRNCVHVEHGDVEYVVAHGLNTEVNGNRVLVGSRHYLETHEGIDFAPHESTIAHLAEAGKALLYVAERETLVGLVAVRDELRAEAAPTLARLRALGVERLAMLTGDTRSTAEALAMRLSIDRVYAERAPQDKGQLIEELRAAGHKVVFVGDGVNDAPALMSAHVGVAMADGALLSREAADVIMRHDGLATLVQAREIALDTRNLIRSNFNIDLTVNSVLLFAATFGWLPPVAAALLHNGTTLAILARALRTDTRRVATARAERNPSVIAKGTEKSTGAGSSGPARQRRSAYQGRIDY